MAKRITLKNTFLLLSFLASTAAFAGVVFVPRAQPDNDSDNQDYPPSYFGAPDFGVRDGYAARQVNDMDTTGNTDGASRGIASVRGDEPGNPGPPGSSGAIAESPIVTTQASATQDIPQSVVARKGVQEVSIIASDLGYFPKTIFVSRDVPVRLYVTGASKHTLCIMMDSFNVRKEVKENKIEEITFLPNVPGQYRFYCPVNGMEGTMVVKALTTDPAGEFSRRMPASVRQMPSIVNQWHSAIGSGGSNDNSE